LAHIDTKTSCKKNLYKSIMGANLDFSMEKFSLSVSLLGQISDK